VTRDCNGCNESLDEARNALAAALRLALVAENALVNGDLQRARAALRNLHHATSSGAAVHAGRALSRP
jgi:hypothetical protein